MSEPAQVGSSPGSTGAGSFGPGALLTPANAVSLVRIVATPAVVALVVIRGPSLLAVGVWVVLAGTDWVDGWIARRQGATRSGAFLDPLADKFLVLGALGAIAARGEMSWVPVSIIAGREVVISMYRSWVGRRGISVPATLPAKAKTWLQDLAITLALIPFVADHSPGVVTGVVWAAVVLTVGTGMHYVLVALANPWAEKRDGMRADADANETSRATRSGTTSNGAS